MGRAGVSLAGHDGTQGEKGAGTSAAVPPVELAAGGLVASCSGRARWLACDGGRSASAAETSCGAGGSETTTALPPV